MNSLEEIMKRIRRIINNEIDLTKRELEEYKEKQRDVESYWGVGGNYRRYEKCVDKREAHLEELEALTKQATQGVVQTETLRLYPWYCPTCQTVIYLSDKRCRTTANFSEIIDCPVCQRTLYRAGKYTTWEAVRNSRRTEVGPG